jgi:hypothetical protein
MTGLLKGAREHKSVFLHLIPRNVPAMRFLSLSMAVATLALGATLSVRAQEDRGPMAPPPKFEVKRISAEPHPGPPPIPEAEIISRFSANEIVMKAQYDAYSFKEAIRVEELTDPGGKFSVSGEVYSRPNGERYLRITTQPESNLKLTNFTLEDIKTIATLPLFVLTSDEIKYYDFKYAGQDKLDQINTYVFQVKPKQLSRTRRLFEGVIWVDDQDFVIVKSFGKFVSEYAGPGTKLPFTMFETFRENFQDKYWLPTYTRSDDYSEDEQKNEMHLRLVIRDTDFKLTAPPNPASATPAASASPAKPAAADSNSPLQH